jgi:exopolyphosphatase / guanosine-5'-triphosphate,3'-diphosphate pyrophosphatase
MCLRLAAIKCHARGVVNPLALKLRGRGRDAQLNWHVGWPDSHPRTMFLLREEANAWSRSGPLRLVLPSE